jgi:adenylosuccinate synthase
MSNATESSRPNPAAAQPALPEALTRGHSAIVGLQWGDEGKGQIVDMLADGFDLVIRYNGGNNAGHSVHIGDQKFALHLVPSGIIHKGTLNVIGNGVVVDPVGILKEITGLRERGVPVSGKNLRISDRAHVVLPYHKLYDKLLDMAIAKSQGDAAKIGTTGRGIGPCYADKALRSTAVRMGELTRPDQLATRLKHIVAVKNIELKALADAVGDPFEPFNADQLLAEYAGYGKQLGEHVCDTPAMFHDAIQSGKRLLFEGANATLLDVDHGTYPFVTSSSTSSLGIYCGAGVPGGTLSNIVGIVKSYASRVGGGPHPTELHDETGNRIREVGKEFGTTTGRPRRVGWLDLTAIRYTARITGVTMIASTGLAVLSGLPKLKVCVGYKYKGADLPGFPADASILADAEPVYHELEGFAENISECRSFDELPPAAKRYIEYMEKFVGVPVKMVCVGRRRDQILYR